LTFLNCSLHFTGFCERNQAFLSLFTLKTLVDRVSEFSKKAKEAFDRVEAHEDLKKFYTDFLSKKSELGVILQELKTLPSFEKKTVGQEVQKVRVELFDSFEAKKKELEQASLADKLNSGWIDITKNYHRDHGSLHPISRVQKRVEEIFTSMGFEIYEGPEVETEWRNFDALNIPSTHPARDMQDTFFINSKAGDSHKNTVLRTHTSNNQIRRMMEGGVPVRVAIPGRCYRNEAIDASHDAIFYQVEGLMVDKGISLAHLKGTIQTMLSELFEKEVTIRFRPGYFPFVEPGLEVDFSCLICNGKGCKTCKNSGWIEFMGAGMVHPNVLRNCGVDPEEYSGFAFGFGLTRLAMMKYGIDDIRMLFSQKKEFLVQF